MHYDENYIEKIQLLIDCKVFIARPECMDRGKIIIKLLSLYIIVQFFLTPKIKCQNSNLW